MSIAKYFELKEKLKNIEDKINGQGMGNNLAGSLSRINEIQQKMLQVGGLGELEEGTVNSLKTYYCRLLMVYLGTSSANVDDLKKSVSSNLTELRDQVSKLSKQVNIGSSLGGTESSITDNLDLSTELGKSLQANDKLTNNRYNLEELSILFARLLFLKDLFEISKS
tara:strand:+ start:249 stop:749 length:501 start_codon:yes stop_codon:yes gene_type:complete